MTYKRKHKGQEVQVGVSTGKRRATTPAIDWKMLASFYTKRRALFLRVKGRLETTYYSPPTGNNSRKAWYQFFNKCKQQSCCPFAVIESDFARLNLNEDPLSHYNLFDSDYVDDYRDLFIRSQSDEVTNNITTAADTQQDRVEQIMDLYNYNKYRFAIMQLFGDGEIDPVFAVASLQATPDGHITTWSECPKSMRMHAMVEYVLYTQAYIQAYQTLPQELTHYGEKAEEIRSVAINRQG